MCIPKAIMIAFFLYLDQIGKSIFSLINKNFNYFITRQVMIAVEVWRKSLIVKNHVSHILVLSIKKNCNKPKKLIISNRASSTERQQRPIEAHLYGYHSSQVRRTIMRPNLEGVSHELMIFLSQIVVKSLISLDKFPRTSTRANKIPEKIFLTIFLARICLFSPRTPGALLCHVFILLSLIR